MMLSSSSLSSAKDALRLAMGESLITAAGDDTRGVLVVCDDGVGEERGEDLGFIRRGKVFRWLF